MKAALEVGIVLFFIILALCIVLIFRKVLKKLADKAYKALDEDDEE